MRKRKTLPGKVLYGLLFTVVIPFLLILWAKYTADIVTLPVPGNLLSGYILLITGVLFVLSGMWSLWRLGNGLPMNAFPPERFVKKGIYAFARHPIYMGAALVSFGLSAVTRSASGFWLVSPLFTLMMVAYVTGFENERTLKIFGTQDYKPFLSLPAASGISPSPGERLSSYFLVFVPWLVIYVVFMYLGIPEDAISTILPFEEQLPVWEFSGVIFSLTWLFVLAVPLVIRTGKQLRCFIADMWFAIIIAGLIYLLLPAALPSSGVILALMAATYFSRSFSRFKWIWFILAVLISVSCITTGINSLLSVVAGFCMFIIVLYRKNIWDFVRRLAESISNSWHEWRWGPVRIINHGFYGGAAGFAGTLIACFFAGRHYAGVIFFVLTCAIIGAGLWAQIIEGSSKLLRPYGYYGGLIGGMIACILASLLFSINIFILLASFAMAAPWIQILGRLRCLVQGCCHGKPCSESLGIRFTKPYSRVNKISGLAGVPLHPTQLYSIGTNIITGLVLIRLFTTGVPSSFIIGIYFIFNGMGRFVEESLRGESQTQYLAGMRIYQWIAIINIIIGAGFTVIPGSGGLSFHPDLISLIPAAGMGILVTIASGVDFPESNRRFARLTSN
ncbi:MAG: prolipoprotein diacylglyceryl transferase family protein [Bacteroidota bacterium]